MSLAPLLAAPWQVELHAFAAVSAFVLGCSQIVRPKGTLHHRAIGWAWVVLMTTVAITSFFIHTICQVGGFSWIHLLSVVTLVTLPIGVLHARHHRVQSHQFTMLSLFLFALVIAGLFTFVPGRIMHAVAFGGEITAKACS